MQTISNIQIQGKEQIGELDGNDVYEIVTKGGLYLDVVMKKDGQLSVLSTGSHKAIARHIAQKDNPELKITKLTKSESLPPQILEANLPEFIELTKKMQEME
jgi:hypothetical protein